MPRRHPKPEEKRSSSSYEQRARRQRRAERRKARSSSGRGPGFLSLLERQMLEDEVLIQERRMKEGAPDAEMKLANLRRELRADERSMKKKRSSGA